MGEFHTPLAIAQDGRLGQNLTHRMWKSPQNSFPATQNQNGEIEDDVPELVGGRAEFHPLPDLPRNGRFGRNPTHRVWRFAHPSISENAKTKMGN